MPRGTMQLSCRLVPPPTLAAHPKKMSLLLKHGVDVDMPIRLVPWVRLSVTPPLKNPSYATDKK